MEMGILNANAASQDMQGHWASESIATWTTRGILNGYEDGTFRPNGNITRAEFTKIINSVFGFQKTSSEQFADVSSSAWYANDILKARAAGYFKGTAGNLASPDQLLSRQDAATILDRVFLLKSKNDGLNSLNDSAGISNYAKDAVRALVNAGAISGYPDGSFKPNNPITRAETIKIIDELIKGFYNNAGTYSAENIAGNSLVNTSNVILKNITIDGDLYLTAGIGEGQVILDGVKVTGTVYISGGGANGITILNSNLGSVVINKVEGHVHVAAQGTTTIASIDTMVQANIEVTDTASVSIVSIQPSAVGTTIIGSNGIGTITNNADNVKVDGKEVEKGSSTPIKTTPTPPTTSTGGGSSSDSKNIATLNNLELAAEKSAVEPYTIKFDKAFSSTTTDYTVTVHTDVTSATIVPTLASSTASVTINGTSVVTGAPYVVDLTKAASVSVYNIVVTAQDGKTTKTYTLTINRVDLSKTYVKSLIAPGVWRIQDYAGTPAYEDMYLFIGSTKALLIDTGMGKGDLNGYVRSLIPADMPLEVALTHTHPDHIGQLNQFSSSTANSVIYISPEEIAKVNTKYVGGTYVPVVDGDIIDLGGRQIEVIENFGHTVGSISFLDAENKIIATGDSLGSGSYVWMQISSSAPMDVYVAGLKNLENRIKDFDTLHFLVAHHWQEKTPLVGTAGKQLVTDMRVIAEKVLSGEVVGEVLTTFRAASNGLAVLWYNPDNLRSNTLSKLSVKKVAGAEITLSPAFSTTVTNYSMTVGNDVSAVEITPTVASAAYKGMTISTTTSATPSAVTSGMTYVANLEEGSNTITIVVTAPDNVTKTYTLNITREDIKTDYGYGLVDTKSINLSDNGVYTLKLQVRGNSTWTIDSGIDVTKWFVNNDGSSVFMDTSGVATAQIDKNNTIIEITLDASKISGFTNNGAGYLYVMPPTEAISAGTGAYKGSSTKIGTYTIPTLSVVSDLFGSAYTHGKSTLKSYLGTDVEYDPNTNAILTLELENLDDNKIDSSKAVVQLDNGDGYYPSEFKFIANSLLNNWTDGVINFNLNHGDLEWDTGDYVIEHGGREWSALGGDGNGHYHFNLTVSGITYNGLPLASQTFQLHVYIYGYNYTNDAITMYPSSVIQDHGQGNSQDEMINPVLNPYWTWIGIGVKPNLADNLVDDFYVTWPEEVDASNLTSSDITMTLYNQYGFEKMLMPDKDYSVNYNDGKTNIKLTYQNWSYTPAYSTMTIKVDKTNLKFNENLENSYLTKSYDIGSVYVYEVQQGGGGPSTDLNNVVAYSFYGLANLTAWDQVVNNVTYTLRYTQDSSKYYTEDENGNGQFITSATLAKNYSGTGEVDRNLQLIGNTVYITARSNQTEEKVIDGVTYTFTKIYSGGGLKTPANADVNLETEPGYMIGSNWLLHEKWAWQQTIKEGWTGIDVTPYTGRYVYDVAKGSAQQFHSDVDSVTWSIVGAVKEGTTISQTGLLNIAANETVVTFSVRATSKTDPNLVGTIAINVK